MASSSKKVDIKYIRENNRSRYKELLLAGDETAWQDTSKIITNMATRYLTKQQDVEELVEEVIVRLCKNGIESYEPNRRYETWIDAITKHAFIDSLRRSRARIKPLPLDIRQTDSVSGTEYGLAYLAHDKDIPEPDQHSIRESESQLILKALRELPNKQAKVLSEVYFRGMSLRQLSDAENIPLGTVKSLLSRGLESLRKRYSSIDDLTKAA